MPPSPLAAAALARPIPKKQKARRKTAKTPGKKKKKKYTVQDVYARFSRAFGPNPRCVVDDTSTAHRLRKTPKGDPERCLGSVRLGQDGMHLYIAEKTWKKNPKIKYSTTPTGTGYHLAFKWTKLYDKRTKKPFKLSDAPKGMTFLS